MYLAISLLFVFINGYSQIDDRVSQFASLIEANQVLGHHLTQQDWAAEVGTDAIIRLGADLSDKKLKAFMVEKLESSWILYFVGKKRKSVGIFYQIEVNIQGPIDSTYKVHKRPTKLTKKQMNIFKATQLAKQQEYKKCMSQYNNVAIPLVRVEGNEAHFYVYFLATTDDPEINIGGGHQRFLINVEKNEVVEHYAHTNDCLVSDTRENTSSLVYTHMTSDTPNEFHIYMSYLYEMPFYILTVNNNILWKVYEGKIIPIDFPNEENVEISLQDRMSHYMIKNN